MLKDKLVNRKELILHIGSDKAGSSAIQAHIGKNLKLLHENGVYVPTSGAEQRIHHQEIFRPLTVAKLEKLREELIGKTEYRKFLLSWEGLHFLKKEKVKILADVFSGFSIKVIFYVREQADIIQSGIFQEIKGRVRHVNFKWERRHWRLPKNRDYFRTVENWKKIIPKIEVEVILYDKDVFGKEGLINDFFGRLGCKKAEISRVQGLVNLSLDVPSVELLYDLERELLDKNGVEGPRWRNFIDLLLSDVASKDKKSNHFYLKERTVKRIRRHYYANNKKLIEKYGVSERLIKANKCVWVSKEAKKNQIEEKCQILNRVVPLMPERISISRVRCK